jgi:hypothetical protein
MIRLLWVADEPIACALSLCLAVILVLPVATPKELKNNASFALGNFTNRANFSLSPKTALIRR